MLQNDLLLKAARGEATERPPVWMMRQAGRILPEYRAVRNSLSGFKELVTTPDKAAEVTLQPVDILGVDAAIIFSDILVIPEAVGLDYEMVEKRGPHFPEVVRNEAAFEKLSADNVPEKLAYVTDAIRETKKRLADRVPLIGFAGAPFTIFTYMVEGGGSKTFSHARRLLYQQPELAHKILQLITDATIVYLRTQIEAGANLVQVFDSWAGILSPSQYSAFSTPYMRQICEALKETHPDTPITLFAKGAWFALPELAELDCDVLGLDWTITPEEGLRLTKGKKTLQGNLDPCALYAPKERIAEEAEQMIAAFKGHPLIVNLGHGLYPDTDWTHAKHFVDSVKAMRYAKA